MNTRIRVVGLLLVSLVSVVGAIIVANPVKAFFLILLSAVCAVVSAMVD
jgi:hypothetical protein